MLVHVAFASQLAEPELHSSMSLQVVPVRPCDHQPHVALVRGDLGRSGGGLGGPER